MDRVYGSNDFEYSDLAWLCMTGGDTVPDGLLWGYDCDGTISGTYDAEDDIIIGAIDAPHWIPAGCWELVDCSFMRGAFAQIVSRDGLGQ